MSTPIRARRTGSTKAALCHRSTARPAIWEETCWSAWLCRDRYFRDQDDEDQRKADPPAQRELFNIFNHPNFAPPAATIINAGSSCGPATTFASTPGCFSPMGAAITSLAGSGGLPDVARQAQFSAKLTSKRTVQVNPKAQRVRTLSLFCAVENQAPSRAGEPGMRLHLRGPMAAQTSETMNQRCGPGRTPATFSRIRNRCVHAVMYRVLLSASPKARFVATIRGLGSVAICGNCSVPSRLPWGEVIQISFPRTVEYTLPSRSTLMPSLPAS